MGYFELMVCFHMILGIVTWANFIRDLTRVLLCYYVIMLLCVLSSDPISLNIELQNKGLLFRILFWGGI